MSDRFTDSQADAIFRRLDAERNPKPAQVEKPYGWDVEAVMQDGGLKTFHYVGTESTARYKTKLKSGVRSILTTSPLTKEQWIRAYGDPTLRM